MASRARSGAKMGFVLATELWSVPPTAVQNTSQPQLTNSSGKPHKWSSLASSSPRIVKSAASHLSPLQPSWWILSLAGTWLPTPTAEPFSLLDQKGRKFRNASFQREVSRRVTPGGGGEWTRRQGVGGQRDVSLGPGLSLCLGSTPTPPHPPGPPSAYWLGAFLNSPSSLASTFLYFPAFLRLLTTRTTTPATTASATTTMTATRPGVRRFMENWGGCSSR